MLAVAGALLNACVPTADGVRLAIATPVMDHGGVPALVRTIAARSGTAADLIALQTPQALRLLAAGDLDGAIVDSHTEAQAYAAHHPQSRLVPLWRLQLVLVGPVADPARAAGLPLGEAFRRIAATQSPFVSVGDHGGVHRREQELWVAVGHPRRSRWYHESGNGLRQAMVQARQLQAYLLTDAATATVAASRLGALRVLCDDGAGEALDVDLLLADGKAVKPFWRALADALPAGLTVLPKGYGPLNPPDAPAASSQSR
jgi:tungstate transport system substrate-binding protein